MIECIVVYKHEGSEKKCSELNVMSPSSRNLLQNNQEMDGSGSSDPALTISFVKKESSKPNLKSRESVCLPNLNWE